MKLEKESLLALGLNEEETGQILTAHRSALEQEIAAWREEHAIPPFEPEEGFLPETPLCVEELHQLSGTEINRHWPAVKDLLAACHR